MTDKRKAYSTPEQQAEADKRYREKNKSHRTYLSKRSTAKSFIRLNATAEDLNDLMKLIEEIKKER